MVNLKLAARTLTKTPFVTGVAVLSLALGIGANVAIFSLFNLLLMRPLPVSNPGELVNLAAPGPKPGSQSCSMAGPCEDVFSYAMFRDLERAQTVFTGLAAHVSFGANVGMRDQTPINARGMFVSGSYFPVLGLRPALGRLITPEFDQSIGAHPVAVLSHSYWQDRLGSDPAIIDKTIIVNGQPLTVIGVAPPGFTGTVLGQEAQIFVPMTTRSVLQSWFRDFERRNAYWAYLFGRLKPGVTFEQAQQAINAIYRPIINDVEAPLQEGMSEQTMTRFKAKQVVMTPGSRGQSSVRRDARTPILLLFGLTGVVLLSACANIANLLLARGANRSTEMAVRLSLGAGRRQLLAQLLTESVLLALVGGVASIVVARWTLAFISSILPPDAPDVLAHGLNFTVLAFATGLAVATGFLFGLFPALQSTRSDLITSIRASAGQHGGTRAAARVRVSLVTAQIALSTALLISAGLFIKSLSNVSRIDLGIKADNVVVFGLSPVLNGYTPERSRALFQRVEEEFRAMPGVTGVAASLVGLLAGNNWGTSVNVQGFEETPDTDDGSRYNEVSPGFFQTLGIPLLAGREFDARDALGSAKVAIVNEAFAKKFGLGRDAVGKFMATDGDSSKLDIEIVGLVQNAKYSEVKDEIPPQFAVPYAQDSTLGDLNFYVRTSLDPSVLLRRVPQVIARIDPNLPVENLKTFPEQIRENVVLDRMVSTLAGAFAVLATLLAAVGLYGVLAYSVAQRTREIGVRMALGANSGRVRTMVMAQVGRMTAIGAVIGIAGALAIGKAAQSLLYGMQGHDPLVFAAAVAVLSLVAGLAGFLPALRASRVHPMQALRYE